MRGTVHRFAPRFRAYAPGSGDAAVLEHERGCGSFAPQPEEYAIALRQRKPVEAKLEERR
jgi:hypothetical protein